MTDLLSKDHSILEKGFMEFRAFGVGPGGEKIRDVSGTTVRANVDCLEELVTRAKGPKAGSQAVEELCRLLNERIRDRAYHVTPKFLRNVWNSYSYEFVMFMAEFCRNISGDPQFQFHVGKRFLSPLIQTLGRPFSVSQIYRMFPHFGDKFVKGSIQYGIGMVTDCSAVLSMKYADHVDRQFGPYRNRCADLICQCVKAALSSVPERIHHLKPAGVKDLACIADGAPYCEWEFTWEPRQQAWTIGPVGGLLLGVAVWMYLHLRYPAMAVADSLILAVFPAMALWFANNWRILRAEVRAREQLIEEQLHAVEVRHEELREAYLEQEHTSVELRRKIGQLTTLHQAGLLFSSTLDQEVLLQAVLQAMIQNLHYDRAKFVFYDADRQIAYDARVIGVTEEIVAFARAMETPIVDPNGIESRLFLAGKPILVADVRDAWDRLHPLNRELVARMQTKSFISVPLKVKDRIIGALTVDRLQDNALTQDDLDLMLTVASQLALALDNAVAYQQVEELNIGLEAKVLERTAALEKVNQELQMANEQLRELNHLKSAFVSTVSHELRTPMTSIKAYAENMLDGLAGDVTDKQRYYLSRINFNAQRLTRMINDLLDLSRIESGRTEMCLVSVSVPDLVADVVESLQPIAHDKSITLAEPRINPLPMILGDKDKLHQILTNLIHNAIKFTPKYGEVLVMSEYREDGFVQICVTDTGCGIPPQEIPKVFDKFYRGESAPSDARGAGLGLAIAKSLVELHAGRMWVESAPGHGSRFYFTLPAIQ